MSELTDASLQSFVFDATTQRVIKARAVQLKNQGVGYLDAVNRITNEVIEASDGKSNELTACGLTMDLKWINFDTPTQGGVSGAAVGALIGSVGGPVGAAVGAGLGAIGGALFGADREATRRKTREDDMRRAFGPRVQPLVSEVYG